LTLTISDILFDFVQSPPVIYHKIQQALKNPESSFDDFARIIESDPNLTIRILNLVNSPYYGLATKVESVNHAISMVGLEQLIEIALSTEIVNKFRGIPIKLLDIDTFWVHCLACGLAGRAIAASKKNPNPDSYYLAGLLHDIGRLVILKKLPKESEQALAESSSGKKPLSQAELDIIGFNHDEVGEVLLKEWNLPPRMVEAVRYHHSPLKAQKYKAEAAILYLADAVAYDMKLGQDGGGHVPRTNPEVLKLMHITREYIESLRSKIQEQVNETADLLLS